MYERGNADANWTITLNKYTSLGWLRTSLLYASRFRVAASYLALTASQFTSFSMKIEVNSGLRFCKKNRGRRGTFSRLFSQFRSKCTEKILKQCLMQPNVKVNKNYWEKIYPNTIHPNLITNYTLDGLAQNLVYLNAFLGKLGLSKLKMARPHYVSTQFWLLCKSYISQTNPSHDVTKGCNASELKQPGHKPAAPCWLVQNG